MEASGSSLSGCGGFAGELEAGFRILCMWADEIMDGKPKLQGLPATYTESEEEAQTLCVKLKDEVTGVVLELLYRIFAQGGIVARSC